MRQFRFPLVLSPEQILWYYQGHITAVVVQADSGETVQLELRHFRSFIRHEGIRARFELSTTDHGKFISLKKIN